MASYFFFFEYSWVGFSAGSLQRCSASFGISREKEKKLLLQKNEQGRTKTRPPQLLFCSRLGFFKPDVGPGQEDIFTFWSCFFWVCWQLIILNWQVIMKKLRSLLRKEPNLLTTWSPRPRTAKCQPHSNWASLAAKRTFYTSLKNYFKTIVVNWLWSGLLTFR